MKKIILLIISVVLVFTLNSCKKDEAKKTNYFSFKGKEYTITLTSHIELVTDHGTADEGIIHLMTLANISGKDTTMLMLTFADVNSNTLSGNYSSLGMEEMATAPRGLIPYALILGSMISFQDGTGYITGKGGSVDVSISGTNYKINLNDISTGNYADLFDSNKDKNYKYSEVGKITGNYDGIIIKQTEILSLSTNNAVLKYKKIIANYKK